MPKMMKAPKKAPAPKKIAAAAKPRKKSELYTLLAEHNDLSRKQVAGVFETLTRVMTTDLAKPSEGKPKIFQIPGLLKVSANYKPATKAREGINPFTGEKQMFKAKPAKTVIKARALKALKDAV
jgi:nucleoid DNA-binding protein